MAGPKAERISGVNAKAEQLRWRVKGYVYHEFAYPSVVDAKFGKHYKPNWELEKKPTIKTVLNLVSATDKCLQDEKIRGMLEEFEQLRKGNPGIRPLFSEEEKNAIQNLLNIHIDKRNEFAILDGLYSLGLHLGRREQAPVKALFAFISSPLREEKGLTPHESLALTRLSVGDEATAMIMAHAEMLSTDEGIRSYLGSLNLTDGQKNHFLTLIEHA